MPCRKAKKIIKKPKKPQQLPPTPPPPPNKIPDYKTKDPDFIVSFKL